MTIEVWDVVDILSRPDLGIPLMMSCIVLLISLYYLKSNWNAQDNTESNQERKESETLESPKMESTVGSEEELKDLLLDAQDVKMMKKVDLLDTTDPSAVKQYVQQLRSQSYKNDLSDVEKEKEEEAKRQQLAQIYSLMKQEKEKFGETSINDIEDQMSLYG